VLIRIVKYGHDSIKKHLSRKCFSLSTTNDSENSIDDSLFGLSTKIQEIAKKVQHNKENL
jgi:hypothetical protein